MPPRKATFRSEAELDLIDIAEYSRERWGSETALRYVAALGDCCQRLADNAFMGLACDKIRPGLRRMEQGRHVIFYRSVETGILVSRVLHERMLPVEGFFRHGESSEAE